MSINLQELVGWSVFICFIVITTHTVFLLFGWGWGSRGVRAFPRSPRSNSKNHIRLHMRKDGAKESRAAFIFFFICLQHFHKIK
jgi:hypothetical protein